MLSKMSTYLSNLSRRDQKLVILSAAAIIGLSVIGYASIPDANGVIHGCVKKSGGTLRIIDTATATCDTRNETQISWNQTGPTGPQGPAGPAGPQGEPGPAGGTARLITIGTANTGFYELMSSCSDAVRSKDFVKQSDSSILRITYTDQALVNLNHMGAYAVEVLIDGSDLAPTPISHIVANGAAFTAFGFANGIPAGTHTLTTRYNFGSLSPPSTCFRESHYTVEIEEIQQ